MGKFLLAVGMMLGVVVAVAQPMEQSRFAVVGGLARLWNVSTMPVFPGSPECGQFGNGTALGQWGSIRWEYRIGSLPLFVSLAGSYHRKLAELQEVQSNFEVYNPRSGAYEPLVVQYEYQSTLQYLFADLGIAYQLPVFSAFPLTLRLGVDAGMPLLGTAFETYESIQSPEGIRFPDGTRRHLLSSGEVPQTTTSYGVSGAISMAVPVGNAVSLLLEGGYRYGLNSVLADAEWKIHHLQLGLGIQYRMFPAPKPRKPEAPAPPAVSPPELPTTPPALVLQRLRVDTLRLRQMVVTETFPLLPYLFFDSASAQLPQRYRWVPEDKERFTEQQLPRSMLPIYYALLSIIGKRMQQMPHTTLRIVGIARSDEAADEMAQRELARQRAAAVADFLINEWDIDPGRLRIEWRFLPEFASSEAYREGWEENRRVELYSDDPLLLAPVVHSRFFEYDAKDSALTAALTVQPALSAVTQWRLKLHSGDTVIQQWSGGKLRQSPMRLPLWGQTIQYLGDHRTDNVVSVWIRDDRQQQDSAQVTLAVLVTRDTVELSRLSLIVFDFDRYELTPENRVILRRFVGEAVRPESAIRIIGSTDRLGERQYNIELSQKRAESVATFLREVTPDGHLVEVRGIGPSKLRYDNSIPEGRYYCRTVLIEVRNPVRSH